MPDPRRAAVLGSPIEHSLSPVLHTAAYAALGLTDWTYSAIECDEARLPALIASCGRPWAGLSLTMPLKRAVLPLLDRTEPLAAEVGGANTVVFAGGERHGYNTDVPGMVAALAEAGVTGPSSATILGRARPPAPPSPPSARPAWPLPSSWSATRLGPATCWPPRTGWAWRRTCGRSTPRSGTATC